jgi:hypothetical protein
VSQHELGTALHRNEAIGITDFFIVLLVVPLSFGVGFAALVAAEAL